MQLGLVRVCVRHPRDAARGKVDTEWCCDICVEVLWGRGDEDVVVPAGLHGAGAWVLHVCRRRGRGRGRGGVLLLRQWGVGKVSNAPNERSSGTKRQREIERERQKGVQCTRRERGADVSEGRRCLMCAAPVSAEG